MPELINVNTFFQLNANEKQKLLERFSKADKKQKTYQEVAIVKNEGKKEFTITKREFICKLEKCFERFYADMYLSAILTFTNDSSIKSEWIYKALLEARKYYASGLQNNEHIFLLKESKPFWLRNPFTKDFTDDLNGGFILTDRYLYLDTKEYNNVIPIADIIAFEERYQPSENQYIIFAKFSSKGRMREYPLLRLDSRACSMSEKLNKFLSIHQKYCKLISDARI